jgi:hypothetical protein
MGICREDPDSNEERLRTGDDGMQCEKWRRRKKHAY